MSRIHLTIFGVLLISVGLGMAPALGIHLPFVTQGVYWAVPSDPPEASSDVQIFKSYPVSPEYVDEYQQLLERFEAAKQNRIVIFGPDAHALRVIQDTDDGDTLDENADK